MQTARTGVIASSGGNITNPLLLDTYAGAIGAYSTYRLRTLYVGSAIRVRRSSDNAEQNIGFVGNELDTASLLLFVGANNGYVTTVYDQSGNGYDFVQTTADYQPSIVLSGTLLTKNGKPTIVFDGVSDYMEIPTSTGNLSFLHKTGQSFISVVGYNRIAKDSIILANNYGASANVGYSLQTTLSRNISNFTTRGVSGQPTINNTTTTAPITANSLFLLNEETDNGNATASLRSKIYVNNGSALNLNASTNTPSSANATYNLFLGVAGGSTRYGFFDGGISQLIIYNSNQSSNRVGISTAISTDFNIVTDADALAYIAAAGITDTTQQVAANTLFIDLKVAGVYTKMTAFYPMLGGNAFSHKFNAKDPRDLDAAYRLSFVGGWTHSDRGALPNGTTAYANTFFAPLTQSMATNSFTLFSYNRNGDTGTSRCYIGSIGGAGATDNFTALGLLSAGTKEAGTIAGLSDGTQYAPTTSNAVYNGLKLVTTNGDRGARYYKNNTFVSDANTQTKSFDAYPLYVGALNNYNTSATLYSNQEIALLGIATGLSATEVTALYTAVQKFQTTLKRQISSVTTVDADALAFVTAAAITDQAQATAVDNLVIDLKAASIWTKMKAIYPFVGGTATTHKWNLKDPRDLDAAFRLTFTGGWTHSWTGLKPNGTTAWGNTFLNPSTSLSNPTTSNHISLYIRENIDEAKADMGCGTNPGLYFSISSRVTNVAYVQNNVANAAPSFASTDSRGLLINTRQSSLIYKGFSNGVSQVSSSAATTGIPNTNIAIGGRYNSSNGNIDSFSSKEIAFSSIGDGLTDADCLALYTAVQKYQTALGRYVTIPAVSDTDAQAFINAAVITDWNQATAVNQLVIDLKVANVWTKMKAVYPFVGGTATTHKFNLKDPRDLDAAYRLVFSGGWTHSSTGALPNGTTGYADTKLNPNTVVPTSSLHLSYYSRTLQNAAVGEIGNLDSGTSSANSFYLSYSGTLQGYNGFSKSVNVASQTNQTQGYYLLNAYNLQLKVFKGSSQLGTTTALTVYNTVNNNIYIGAINNTGSANYYSLKEAAFATIGDGLTDAEALALYNAVQKYQMILGRQIV